MKNTRNIDCFSHSSDDRIINSAATLKKYLDKQPANSPKNPINVAIKANKKTLKSISVVLKDAKKYVSIDLSGSPLTTIPAKAFENLNLLASVTIPDNITSIEEWAFDNCKSLTAIIIPDGVTSIGEGAFDHCKRLASIIIPDSVTSIGKGAFKGCSNLVAIYVSSGNNKYASDNGVLYSKDKETLIAYPSGKIETSFTIPDSVTNIGESAFYHCYNLASVTIQDSITSIGEGAFEKGFSLVSVTVPGSVTIIGEGAFSCCYDLARVTIPDIRKIAGLS
jgi:hypothetical protein